MVEKLSFNVSNFYEQQFPFPEKLIIFINKEADAEIKQKLDRTCKHFYNELPYCIIDTLEFNEDKERLENEQYDGCMDFINDIELQIFLMNTSNIWVTKKIVAKSGDASSILSKIVRCDASEISLHGFGISFGKLEIFTKSGKVECFDFMDSLVVDGSVPLEMILGLLPNAKKIRMTYGCIYKASMTTMLSIPWKHKLNEFYLIEVDDFLDPHLFFEFVKKHFESEAKIHLNFTIFGNLLHWFSWLDIFPQIMNKFVNENFQKAYNQKIIESGEKLPTIGTFGPLVEKQTWLEEFIFNLIFIFPLFANPLSFVMFIFQFIQSIFAQSKRDESMPEWKKITFNEDNMERQYLTFPYPHMCYIRESADAETMKKLEQTCKFFHKRNPFLIIDNLHIGTDGKITMAIGNNKIMFENGNEMEKFDKFIWLTNFLDFTGYLRQSIPKLARIDAKKVLLGYLYIQIESFENITQAGLVENWDSIEGFVKSADEKILSLLELLLYLPNAESVRAKVRGIKPRNPIFWRQRQQYNKIKHLHLQFYKQSINADQMFLFLLYFLAPKARLELDFSEMPTEEMDVDLFKAEMKEKLDTWKPQIEKPTFKIVS